MLTERWTSMIPVGSASTAWSHRTCDDDFLGPPSDEELDEKIRQLHPEKFAKTHKKFKYAEFA